MKRVLIITYYWPPSGGSGVQRWVKFAKYLPSEGWQPVIYTPENPELIAIDKTLINDVPYEAEIIKKPIFEPYGIYRRLFRRNSGSESSDAPDRDQAPDKKSATAASAAGEVNPINAGHKSFASRLAIAIRGNCFIPDPRCLWIGPSVRFLKKYLREHPVDIIVSTGPPHSMHLIARKVAAATGIPWVADFRDPWTGMFYFKHLKLGPWALKRHRKLEKQVLDDASVVVAVSPLVQNEFEAMTATPVELITNGYDGSDFHNAVVESDEYFNITHTGLFASDGNPDMLWKVLKDKCSEDTEFRRLLRIRLTGKTDREIIGSIKAHGLGANLFDNGYQPHSVAVKEQKSASLLILPLRKEPEYRATLPGKLFEYLASQRPILGIGQTDGAMAMILSSAKAGVTFDWEDEVSIRKYIDRCWTLFREDNLVSEAENLEQFSRRRLTARMASLFDSLLEK